MAKLVVILRAALPERALSDAHEALLVARVAAAVVSAPGVAVAEDAFVRAIAERLVGEPLEAALAQLHTDDLYLACACAAGDPAGLAVFEARYGATIERAIAATGAAATERADLGQVIRQRMLVAPGDDRPPRIAGYSARGSLAAWVRVIATREAARMRSRAPHEVAASDEELARRIAPDDPQLDYFKRLYRAELKHAFQAAVEALDSRDRLVLRQHALDGLGIDQLAALHKVHRATAARWVEAARAAVLSLTQREMLRRLRIDLSELDSVIRLIRSQLDISLPRLLASS